MSLVEEIRQSWGWIGLDPVEVVGENDFGNLMIKDADGKYWRLCPEDCYCRVVASNRLELDALSTNQDFLQLQIRQLATCSGRDDSVLPFHLDFGGTADPPFQSAGSISKTIMRTGEPLLL